MAWGRPSPRDIGCIRNVHFDYIMPDIILTDFYEFETWTTEFFVQSFNLYRILDITKKKKSNKKTTVDYFSGTQSMVPRLPSPGNVRWIKILET